MGAVERLLSECASAQELLDDALAYFSIAKQTAWSIASIAERHAVRVCTSVPAERVRGWGMQAVAPEALADVVDALRGADTAVLPSGPLLPVFDEGAVKPPEG